MVIPISLKLKHAAATIAIHIVTTTRRALNSTPGMASSPFLSFKLLAHMIRAKCHGHARVASTKNHLVA